MREFYSITEIINFLEQHDFEKFRFADDYAYIYANSAPCEIVIEAPDEIISDEMIHLVIKGLNHIDECLESAYKWLKRMKDACDEELEPFGICFEHYGYGYETKTEYDLGFTIAFILKSSTLNCQFTAKYNAHTFWHSGAFAIEEYYI